MGEIPAAAPGAAVEVPAGRDPAAGLDARFRRPLMKFFMRRVHDVLEAEDLTQEVFTRALGSGELSRVRRADSFLFTVATNLLRDRHRSAVRRSASAARATSIAEGRDPVEDRGPEAGVGLREDPGAYVELSAVFRLNQVKTPLLLAAGDNDGDFLLDTIEMYNGLRSAGVEVTLLRYPDQGHGFSGPAMTDFWNREMAFFKAHLQP